MIKQSFSSDKTNCFSELREKIPHERGIKVILPMRASPPNWASSPLFEQPLNIRSSRTEVLCKKSVK